MADDRLALLRELERADEAIAAELAELEGLHAAVEELRERALDLQELFAGLPGERAAARAAVEEAEGALAKAQAAAERASAELAAAEADGHEERLAAARRFEVRARDSLHVAERRAASRHEHVAELERRAEAADHEAAAMENRARELAATLRERPRLADEAVADPGVGPEGVADWGTRARAALLVARSQLVAEREAVVRQTHELGSLLLGEVLPPIGAAAVARRVERELDS